MRHHTTRLSPGPWETGGYTDPVRARSTRFPELVELHNQPGCCSPLADTPARAGICCTPQLSEEALSLGRARSSQLPWLAATYTRAARCLRLCALCFSSGVSSGLSSPQNTICFWKNAGETIEAQMYSSLYFWASSPAVSMLNTSFGAAAGVSPRSPKTKRINVLWIQITPLYSFQCMTLQADPPSWFWSAGLKAEAFQGAKYPLAECTSALWLWATRRLF